MRRSFALRFGIAIVSLLGLGRLAKADTYDETTLSVEWLVDSSDGIFQAKIRSREGGQGVEPYSVQALKPGFSSEEWLRQISEYDLRPFRYVDPRPGDEVLIFVRRKDNGRAKTFRRVDLTRPTRTYVFAAITGHGKMLQSKEAILQFVRRRVALKRTLPAGCRRELIDRWNEVGLRRLNKSVIELPDDEIAAILGGFWVGFADGEVGTEDDDILLTGAIVPADEQFFDRISDSGTDAIAYLNYPDKRTLKRLSQCKGWSARYVFQYLKWRMLPPDPLQQKLVGTWMLLGNRESVYLNLRADQTCDVITIPKPDHTERGVTGRGYWAVRDGRFWLRRIEARHGEKWYKANRSFFRAAKRVEQATAGEIVLQGGPPMKRAAKQVPAAATP